MGVKMRVTLVGFILINIFYFYWHYISFIY